MHESSEILQLKVVPLSTAENCVGDCTEFNGCSNPCVEKFDNHPNQFQNAWLILVKNILN